MYFYFDSILYYYSAVHTSKLNNNLVHIFLVLQNPNSVDILHANSHTQTNTQTPGVVVQSLCRRV